MQYSVLYAIQSPVVIMLFSNSNNNNIPYDPFNSIVIIIIFRMIPLILCFGVRNAGFPLKRVSVPIGKNWNFKLEIFKPGNSRKLVTFLP